MMNCLNCGSNPHPVAWRGSVTVALLAHNQKDLVQFQAPQHWLVSLGGMERYKAWVVTRYGESQHRL